MKVWIVLWEDRPPEAYATHEALEKSIIEHSGYQGEATLNDIIADFKSERLEVSIGDDHYYFDDFMMAELVEVQE